MILPKMFILENELLSFCRICGKELKFNKYNPNLFYCSKSCLDKDYYKRNKNKIIERVGAYKNKRIKTDIEFRIICNLRTRLYLALKGQLKADTTMNLVGCSREYLLNYLESQFDDEMSWSNYGRTGWHIDHIKPCSYFDLSKKEEQRKCFHYTNLKPLWGSINIKKGNKYVV